MKKTLLSLFLLLSLKFTSLGQGVASNNDETKIRDIAKSEITSFINEQKKKGTLIDDNDLKGLEKNINKRIDEALIKLNAGKELNRLTIETKNADRKNLIDYTGNYSNRSHILINNILTSFELNEINIEILALNSPTDNTLGFSLKEVINKMVEKIILEKTGKKNSDAEKISGIINAIIENPLTKVVGTAVPVINNVIGFISNLSIGNKRITPDDLKEFIRQTDQYFRFYEKLAENNKAFKANMNELKVKGEALKIILENFITERSKILYGKEISKDDLEISKLLSEYINESGIESRFKQLTTKADGSKLSPDEIIKIEALIMPSTTASQSQYLIDEIESLANQYIKAYKKYIEAVIQTLEAAKSLKNPEGVSQADAKIIDAKKQSLLNGYDKWEAAFKASLGIKPIKEIVLQMTKLTVN